MEAPGGALSSEGGYRQLLYGPDGSDQPMPLLSLFSSDGCPVEGVYLRIDEGPYLKYRAKIVRGDFIQAIEDGGRWEKKATVIQGYDKDEWAYFNAMNCDGVTNSIHAPARLDED